MIELCSYFPPLKIRMQWKTVAFLGHEPQRYACMALVLTLGVSAGLLFFSPLAALIALVFLGIFFTVLPSLKKTERARDIEAELPLFLRSLGMLLEFGVPLERSLEIAAGERGVLCREIGIWIGEMRSGMGLRKALSLMALQYESMALKRAVSSLLISLESGSRGAEIRKIGDDLLIMEQHRMKEYSSKSAIFGLILIVVSAIMPTFFLIYSVSGLGEADQGQASLAMLVVFPMLSLLVIMLSRSMMPKLVFSGPGFDLLPLAPGAFIIAGYAVFPAFKIPFASAGIICGAYILFKTFARERRAEEIERSIPDALLSAGGMPGSTHPEKLFDVIAEGGFGALSEEAAKSRSQLRSSVSLSMVLDDLWRRNRSVMLERSCAMLRQMMDSGSLGRIGILAEDMIRHLQLRRERAASFSMQKYTLLAGALIIPLIMKMTLGLLEEMGGIAGPGADLGPVSALIPPYLLIYSVIASAAIGDYEGRRSSAIVYLAAMSGTGLLAFHFINF